MEMQEKAKPFLATWEKEFRGEAFRVYQAIQSGTGFCTTPGMMPRARRRRR